MIRLARIFLFGVFVFTVLFSSAQQYFANGDGKAVGGDCYELTPDLPWKLGSVWYSDKIDISKDFDLEFYLNFGNRDGGADGIVFVMQTVGNKALGKAGGGLGFEGFKPSLGIEFDDFYNADVGDITADHIAVQRDGSVKHNGADNIVKPVTARADGGNIEDGQDHLVRIVWEVATKRLTVYFDCEQRISTGIDLEGDIFKNTTEVFWGFTAATGGLNNRQRACLRKDILVPKNTALCKGDSIFLNAREISDGLYTWKPNLYLNDATVRTPICSSIVPMEYTVTFADLCGEPVIDTVRVAIDLPFTMDEGQDTLLCDGERYYFDLRGKYDSVMWNGASTQKYTYWDMPNEYRLRVWKGVCYDDDTFRIRTNESPELTFEGERKFCEGDSTRISLVISPADVRYVWQDGDTEQTKFFKNSTITQVTATNECATRAFPLAVEELTIEDLDLGNDTILCIGDTITLNPGTDASYNYTWSTGSSSPTLQVLLGGSFWVEVNREDLCSKRDTIDITDIYKPNLADIEDVLLCKNEQLNVYPMNEHGSLLWNGKDAGDTYTLFNDTGFVYVISSNACGQDSVSFDVTLKDCKCNLEYPNALTPNGDILNPTLSPYINCPKLNSFNQKIYNRYGQLIYASTDVSKPWDGTYKGTNVEVGVYFWIAEWTGIENGFNVRKVDKGIIHVEY